MRLKYVLFIMVLLVIPLMSYSQDNIRNDSTIHEHDNIQRDTLKYTIYGMDCPGCEGGIEKQVDKITSVEYSKANWVDQELIIVLRQDSVLDIETLRKRVKKANFTLDTEKQELKK